MGTLEEKIDEYVQGEISLEEIEGVTGARYFGNVSGFTINNHLVEIAPFNDQADIQIDGEPFITNYFDKDSVICRKYFSREITKNDYYGLPDEGIDETKNYDVDSEKLLDLIIKSDKPYHADEYLQAYNAGEISDLTKQLEEELSTPKEPLAFTGIFNKNGLTSIYINQDATYTEKHGDEIWCNGPVTSKFIEKISKSEAIISMYHDHEDFKDPKSYWNAMTETAKLYEQQIRGFIDTKALEQYDHSKFMVEHNDGLTRTAEFFNINDYDSAMEFYDKLPAESYAELSIVDENYEFEEYDINIVDEDPDATDDFEDVDIE